MGRPGPSVMACAALAGERVVNRAGEVLGTLDHFMIEVESGRVAYGVLARGGVLGLGARLFAIPWRALALDPERGCFVLDLALEHLRRAPGFDREHWAALADPVFAHAVDEFYRRVHRDAAGVMP